MSSKKKILIYLWCDIASTIFFSVRTWEVKQDLILLLARLLCQINTFVYIWLMLWITSIGNDYTDVITKHLYYQ